MKTAKSTKTETSSLRRRKTKFINVQRHKASCGPIAIANLIKWCGIETSYAKVLGFCIGVRAFSNRAGMWPFQMRYVLKTLKVRFKVKRKFSVADLDALLDAGGCCILAYCTKFGGHAVFIDKRTSNGYRSWNRVKGKPPFFSKKDLQIALRRSVGRRNLHVYTFEMKDR